MGNYKEYLLKTSYTDDGSIYDSVKYRQTAKTKGGWQKMYKGNYLEIQELCIKSLTDLRLWNYCIDKTTTDFSIKLNVKSLAAKIGVSRQKVHQFLKSAIENDALRKEDGYYYMNPFIIVPRGISDDESAKAQDKWKGK